MSCCDLTLTVNTEDPITLEIVEAVIKPEQAKTVTPTYSQQTVLPDAGMTLGSVTVEPIPDPTERLTITENGSYDVARIGGVDVAVPVPPGYVPAPDVGCVFSDYREDNHCPETVTTYGFLILPSWHMWQFGYNRYNRSIFLGFINKVILNDEIEMLEMSSMRQMSKLTSLKFPSALRNIDQYCFADTPLQFLDFSSCVRVPTIYSNSFTSAEKTIRVPASLLDEWRSADVWRDLSNVTWEGV